MPWNLLIFPLASGYYLLTRSYFFKFKIQRQDRHKLIYESVLLGTLISGIAYFLRLSFLYCFPETFNSISSSFPLKIPYSITALSTVILAIAFCKISNYLLNKAKFVKRAIKSAGNEFELLMMTSVVKKELLLFTLGNKKSYVGWVKELPIPSASKYVRIVPAISGFRNEEKDIVFTSQYLEVYAEYIKEGKITSIDELKTDLIIDLQNIITVSFFDMELYERFNSVKSNLGKEEK